MQKVMYKLGSLAAFLALVATAVSVNQACYWFVYQDEVPSEAKALRKF